MIKPGEKFVGDVLEGLVGHNGLQLNVDPRPLPRFPYRGDTTTAL
jgi:hypothetical protein